MWTLKWTLQIYITISYGICNSWFVDPFAHQKLIELTQRKEKERKVKKKRMQNRQVRGNYHLIREEPVTPSKQQDPTDSNTSQRGNKERRNPRLCNYKNYSDEKEKAKGGGKHGARILSRCFAGQL